MGEASGCAAAGPYVPIRQAAAGKPGIASLNSNISVHLTLLLQGEGLLKPDVQRLLPSALLLHV